MAPTSRADSTKMMSIENPTELLKIFLVSPKINGYVLTWHDRGKRLGKRPWFWLDQCWCRPIWPMCSVLSQTLPGGSCLS